MQFRKKHKRSLVLNLTSLIDVLFLLLIFFMISTTFLNAPAIKLELPEAAHADTVKQEPITVFIGQNGAIYLNDDPIDRALLGAALKNKLATSEDKAVVLKADSRVSHGDVVRVMDIVKGAGAKRLVISTQPAK